MHGIRSNWERARHKPFCRASAWTSLSGSRLVFRFCLAVSIGLQDVRQTHFRSGKIRWRYEFVSKRVWACMHAHLWFSMLKASASTVMPVHFFSQQLIRTSEKKLSYSVAYSRNAFRRASFAPHDPHWTSTRFGGDQPDPEILFEKIAKGSSNCLRSKTKFLLAQAVTDQSVCRIYKYEGKEFNGLHNTEHTYYVPMHLTEVAW